MRQPDIDDRVRLTHDVPNLYLHAGTIGVIRSKWFEPTVAFEVEFGEPGLDSSTRAVLMAEQLQLEENAQQSA